MKIWVVIPSSNFSRALDYLLQSLAMQDDLNFEVVVIGDDVDIAASVSFKKIRTHKPHFPFHRSKTRNQFVAIEEISDEDVILFTDADAILSPNFIKETRAAHLIDPKAITYGLRRELTMPETTHLPEKLDRKTFFHLDGTAAQPISWLIRSMFMGVRSKWLKQVGGFPEYMVGWGAEDLALHVGLVERVGCHMYPLVSCIGYHQWHFSEGNFANERKNWQMFLEFRAKKIAERNWFLSEEHGQFAADGRYLLERRLVHEIGRYQLVATDIDTSGFVVVSSADSNPLNSIDGNVEKFSADFSSSKVSFSVRFDDGSIRFFEKDLWKLDSDLTVLSSLGAQEKRAQGMEHLKSSDIL